MKEHWSKPKTAFHRGAEIPFKLSCSFNAGVAEKHKFFSIKETLPQEVREFYLMTDGAILFKDYAYGQWGLKLYRLGELAGVTQSFFKERIRDSVEGDLIIGEFVGDSDLLLLRCDTSSNDFGSVVVVSAIDSRVDWDVAATEFLSFLSKLTSHDGDKYWELMH